LKLLSSDFLSIQILKQPTKIAQQEIYYGNTKPHEELYEFHLIVIELLLGNTMDAQCVLCLQHTSCTMQLA